MALSNNDSTLSWAAFYAHNRRDGGIYEEMFNESTLSLTERTVAHIQSPKAITETISGNFFGTTMVVPEKGGKVHLLHHSFTCFINTGFRVAFFQGNYKESSICKIVDRNQLVTQVATTVGKKTATTNCPTIDLLLKAKIQEDSQNSTRRGTKSYESARTTA